MSSHSCSWWLKGGETGDEDGLPVAVVVAAGVNQVVAGVLGEVVGCVVAAGWEPLFVRGRNPLHGPAMVLLAGAGEAMKVTCHGPGSSREGDPLGVGGRDAGVSRGRYRGGRVSTV